MHKQRSFHQNRVSGATAVAAAAAAAAAAAGVFVAAAAAADFAFAAAAAATATATATVSDGRGRDFLPASNLNEAAVKRLRQQAFRRRLPLHAMTGSKVRVSQLQKCLNRRV